MSPDGLAVIEASFDRNGGADARDSLVGSSCFGIVDKPSQRCVSLASLSQPSCFEMRLVV